MEGPLISYFHEEQTFSRWIPAAVLALIGIPVGAAAVESLVRPDVFFPSVGAIALFVPIGILFLLTRLVVDVTSGWAEPAGPSTRAGPRAFSSRQGAGPGS